MPVDALAYARNGHSASSDRHPTGAFKALSMDVEKQMQDRARRGEGWGLQQWEAEKQGTYTPFIMRPNQHDACCQDLIAAFSGCH